MLSAQAAVVVLNWNGKEDTLACLHSLQEQQDADVEIVVVDNGSVDGSVPAVRDEFPSAVVIETGVNLGYTGGNNVGMAYALDRGAEYILVLNNDTVLDPRCIAHLLADLQLNPDAVAAAPKSFYLDDPERIYFAGGRIRYDGFTFPIGVYRHDGPEFSVPCDTEWLSGCAIMFRSNALREIGLFEPKYFLLYEDADWSLRARKAGYRLRFVPEAKLWHKISPSFGGVWSPSYLYYYTRNACLWIERNFPLQRRPRLYYHAVKRSLGTAVRVSKDVDYAATGDNPLRKAIWRGILDYLTRRFGQRIYSW